MRSTSLADYRLAHDFLILSKDSIVSLNMILFHVQKKKCFKVSVLLACISIAIMHHFTVLEYELN